MPTGKKRSTKSKKSSVTRKMDTNVRNTVIAIVLFGAAVCLLISFIAPTAPLCTFLNNIVFGLFGWCGAAIPLILITVGAMLVLRYERVLSRLGFMFLFLFFICSLTNVFTFTYDPEIQKTILDVLVKLFDDGIVFVSGGIIGGLLSVPFMLVAGKVITAIIFIVAILIVAVVISGRTFAQYVKTPEERKKSRDARLAQIAEKKRAALEFAASAPDVDKKNRREFKIPEPKKKFHIPDEITSEPPSFTTNLAEPESDTITKEQIAEEKAVIAAEVETAETVDSNDKPYIFPSIELLAKPERVNDAGVEEELRKTGEKLVEALRSFSVETHILHASRGPTVTRYELAPEMGVKISKITSLADDIALNLAAKGVRIEAPIPGKSAIGIEVPNKTQQTVYIRELIDSEEFRASKSRISAALGKNISGDKIVVDLAKMPHLLIAGATGTGKSVCINTILMSLLYKSSPDEVKLILVDPKMVEFTVYKGLPHLLIPVVTDAKKAAGALSWAVSEMLNRYQMFANKGVRDFNGYNKNLQEGEKRIPQIVIVIDELSDLMMASPKEVEDAICRLAQMARAAGMHLVIATQRPSADVITGTIKANVPSRIALAVSSGINSRIILDDLGAEKLIGRGDMLYDPIGAPKPLRVQGCFVADKEVERVVEAIKANNACEYDNEVVKKIEQNVAAQDKNGSKLNSSGQTQASEEGDDEMFLKAVEVVVESGQASTSMLQRRIGLGYARAARLIDVMEQRGIVGPYQGSKPRTVLMTKDQFLELKLGSDNPAASFAEDNPDLLL